MTSRLAQGVMENLLEAENLSRRFPVRSGPFFNKGWIDAVHGVSLTIRKGESVGLVGESGCGKSTLARLLCKVDRPTSGSVRYRGRPLEHLRGKSLQGFRRAVQMIFQDPMASLNPLMRIGEIVAEPLVIHRMGGETERRKKVMMLLTEVGLDPAWAGRFPITLSGGQRQRVGVARALALGPDLLICDEPVSSLDLSVQAQILTLLSDLQERRGLSLLFISHNLATVSAISDRILVMRFGRILEEGTNPELFQSPRDPYTRALVKLAVQPL